ncbi:MAG: hypothetical protein HY331_16470, partial [Chloroflexi bacterium]|nr:hypothetical protein [Chloroflexota bacterium]
MPFQRDDITIEERVRIVTTIMSQPDQYGLVTQLAQEHGLSRQSLYTMVQRGREAMTERLLPRPPGRPTLAMPLVIDKNRLDRAIVTFTLAGHASLEGVQGCLAEAFDLHRSIGYISGVLDRAGDAAHTTLDHLCPPKPIRADLDEIFSGATPHPTLIDHDSTLILALHKAESRDATTWGVLLLDQAAKGVAISEAASDGALGIIGGIQESRVVPVRLGDLFHVMRDLMVVAGHLEKRAYAAIGREERARLVDAEAHAVHPRRGPKRMSALSLPEAVAASQGAIRRFDDYVWLVRMVRETLEPVDAQTGRLRAASGSRQELLAVVSLLRDGADEKVTKVAGRLERAIPDLVAYQAVLARQSAPWIAQIGEAAVMLIAWAWRHRDGLGLTTPAAIASAFPGGQHPAVTAVWSILDGVHRGSSLVECINSLLRPHLLVHR